jgi:uncharacterized membrane protein YeaQ/YmgE (transglycosylase-associated protein family)
MYAGTETIVLIIVVGAVAGWIANSFVQSDRDSAVADIAAGIVGAFAGNWLLPRLGLVLEGNMLGMLLDPTLGAIGLLMVLRVISPLLQRR